MAAVPIPFLRSYEFFRNADTSFCCLGRGGNGGVYDAKRKPDALAAAGHRDAALLLLGERSTVLAVKQTFYVATNDEKLIQRHREEIAREGKMSLDLTDAVLGRPTWGVMALTLESHVHGTLGPEDCLVHTVMERSPVSIARAFPDPLPAGWAAELPPRVAKGDKPIGSNTDVLDNPFFTPKPESDTRLSLREARFILKQLLTALRDLHAMGRVHRDVKPDNLLVWGCSQPGNWKGTAVPATEVVDLGDGTAVMVDRRLEGLRGCVAGADGTVGGAAGGAGVAAAMAADGEAEAEEGEEDSFICRSLPFPAGDDETRYVWVKLCDYGYARNVDDGALAKGMTTNPGTLSTMAPETYHPDPHAVPARAYDARCDVFSAGCVFYKLVAGRSALREPAIGLERGRFPELLPLPAAGDARPFAHGSLELDLLRAMTRLELAGPTQRLTAAEALRHPFFEAPL